MAGTWVNFAEEDGAMSLKDENKGKNPVMDKQGAPSSCSDGKNKDKMKRFLLSRREFGEIEVLLECSYVNRYLSLIGTNQIADQSRGYTPTQTEGRSMAWNNEASK